MSNRYGNFQPEVEPPRLNKDWARKTAPVVHTWTSQIGQAWQQNPVFDRDLRTCYNFGPVALAESLFLSGRTGAWSRLPLNLADFFSCHRKQPLRNFDQRICTASIMSRCGRKRRYQRRPLCSKQKNKLNVKPENIGEGISDQSDSNKKLPM